MNLSVIIPTLNEENHIGKLLKDLNSQTLLPSEIIVVDGASVDDTRKAVSRFKNVKFINSKRGVGMQRSLGAKLAQGDYLVFMDADVRISKTFLKKFMKKFITKKLDIAVPIYLPYKSTLIINFVYYLFNAIFIITQKFLPSGAGSCIIIRKTILMKTCPFNPNLIYDDIEFIRRAGRKGKFGVIFEKLYVSDRRFKTYGALPMLLFYMFISIFFVTGLFKLANLIDYKFASYKNK